jgi:hypothetical protein
MHGLQVKFDKLLEIKIGSAREQRYNVRIGKKSVFKLLRKSPEQYSELATGPLPVFFERIVLSAFRNMSTVPPVFY